jgi:hypothetical protein
MMGPLPGLTMHSGSMCVALAGVALVAATGDVAAQPVVQAMRIGDFPYGPLTTFTVLRNGQEIGRHTLRFESKDGLRTVMIVIDYDVKLLGVSAYRFSHRSEEMWKGDQLQSLTARSDENGRKFAVNAQRRSDGLHVEREVPPSTNAADSAFQGFGSPRIALETVPASIMPTSNWNLRQTTQSRLLNTHYGTLFNTRIVPAGRERVRTTNGTIDANRFTYSGDIRMDQWFDDRGRWVHAAFTAFDGSRIEYILQE